MADASASFGRFKWDRAGYAELMDSEAVQGVVKTVARQVRSRATSMLSPDGHTVAGFTMYKVQGKLAQGYAVEAVSKHAKYSCAKHKTLTKAARGVRF